MIFDILLIAFLAFFAWRGKRKGLVAGILGFFSVIISYIVSAAVSKPLFEAFKETDAYVSLLQKAEKLMPENSAMAEGGIFGSVISETQEMMVSRVAEFVGSILISVLVFIAVLIVLKVVIRLLNSVLRLPGLNFLNKTGGLILGTATGFLMVYVILAAWGVFTLFKMPEGLETSQLLKSMFENNLLFLLIA